MRRYAYLLVVLCSPYAGAAIAKKRLAGSQAELSATQRLLAGGSARALSQVVMYPADALRTLAQTRAGSKTLSELGAKTLLSGCATTSVRCRHSNSGPQHLLTSCVRSVVLAVVRLASRWDPVRDHWYACASDWAALRFCVWRRRLVRCICAARGNKAATRHGHLPFV